MDNKDGIGNKDNTISEMTEEELSSVTGGGDSFLYNGIHYTFDYPIGYTTEICDCIGGLSGHCYTHRAVLTMYGLSVCLGHIEEVVYFNGDSDVAGWYPQRYVKDIYKRNYADYSRISNSQVIILKK